MLVDEKPNTTITHIGSQDIIKSKYYTINAEELAKRKINIGLKFKYYGVGQIPISSIFARSNKLTGKFFFKKFCKGYGMLSYVTKILIGIVYGEMIFISQMRVPLDN